jgi:hypothetical protein
MDIKQIEKEELMKEAAYAGNIGFQEMVEFYQKATEAQVKKMEALVKKNNWKGVKALFKAILGVELK